MSHLLYNYKYDNDYQLKEGWTMKSYDNIETMLAFHGAPTLEGIKPGNLISFNKNRIKNCQRILNQYKTCMECNGIYFFTLSETENWLLLFIYRKNTLKQLIQNKEIREFLSSYGYEHCRYLSQYLRYLKIRMSLQKGFPHEIGIFLGYPLDDVKGFIEHSGRHFKISGQWKVYSDTKRAEELFNKYAECSNRYCACLLRGQSIEELVKAV